MRSGQEQRLSEVTGSKGVDGCTYVLARNFLWQTRNATKLRSGKKPFWRRAKTHRRMTVEAERESRRLQKKLFPKFRPVIAEALRDCSTPDDVFGALTGTFYEVLAASPEEECFAQLYWTALQRILELPADREVSLKKKFFLRSMLDWCCEAKDDATAVEWGCYFSTPPSMEAADDWRQLRDLKLESIWDACESIGTCLKALGEQLETLTAGVLSAECFENRTPADVVFEWATEV